MTPREIKSLGSSVWGAQSGLLSMAELELLRKLVQREYVRCLSDVVRVLEVGHYQGLSTCMLVHALTEFPNANWHLTTVDSHESDQWVPASDPNDFDRNRRMYFDDARLTVKFERSQTLVASLPFDVCFYDGDHGQEQARFTGEVLASPRVSLFVFDDRDFAVPAECCRVLIENGWVDESPPLHRGASDKSDPLSMTLGVFRRAS